MDDPESRFTRLYDEHHRRVPAYALAHAEPHTAEDVAGETFLIAWRRLDQVRDPALPWLLGVARNLLRKQYDRGRRGRAGGGARRRFDADARRSADGGRPGARRPADRLPGVGGAARVRLRAPHDVVRAHGLGRPDRRASLTGALTESIRFGTPGGRRRL
ncbi:sigma factor [Spirillospora sp. NPDC052242]